MKAMATLTMVVTLIGMTASCGGSAQDPHSVAESLLEAAKEGDWDEMRTYMTPDLAREFNDGMLSGIDVISYTLDEPEYKDDSTEVEIEYTITLRELDSGDIEEEEGDFELERNSEGNWVVEEM